MKTRHIIIFLMVFSATATEVSGQNWLSRFYNDWLTKPRNVDSNYIYQQSMGFTPSLTSNFSRQRVQMTTIVDIDEFPVTDASGNWVTDANGDLVFAPLTISVVDKMEEDPSSRVGVILGLGRLGAGWSVAVSPDSSQKSSTFLFSFRGNKWGLNINYLGFSQRAIEDCHWLPASLFGASDYVDTFASDNRVRRLSLDGYYVINTRRFAYPPGIAGNMVQIRSAGSWMLAGRYLQSAIRMNPDYTIAQFGMSQLSLGVGYSYTWVPFSRAPHYAESQSLPYTFFINGTIIPMLTLFNYLTVEPYDDLEGTLSTSKKGSFCWPTPNILANATVGFSWNRFYFGAQFNYNVFHFNTRNAISSTGSLQEAGIETMGVLYEWNIGLKFQACF